MSIFNDSFQIWAGGYINALDKSRRTPLHIAATEDKAALISVLLQGGADPDLGDVELNNGKYSFCLFISIDQN